MLRIASGLTDWRRRPEEECLLDDSCLATDKVQPDRVIIGARPAILKIKMGNPGHAHYSDLQWHSPKTHRARCKHQTVFSASASTTYLYAAPAKATPRRLLRGTAARGQLPLSHGNGQRPTFSPLIWVLSLANRMRPSSITLTRERTTSPRRSASRWESAVGVKRQL